MRIFFIAGFGEDKTIFDHLHPYLHGEKTFLDLFHLLPNRPAPALTAGLLAQQVAAQHRIAKQDVVIGHSAGGWVAHHLKQQVGCRVVQIASWTNQRKVVMPLPSRHLLFVSAKTGLLFHPLVFRTSLKKYKGKPSAPVFTDAFMRLRNANTNNVANQLRVIFNPVREPVTVQPDVRIHAREDVIVHVPDEPFHEVPGDHFSLYTHAENVAPPIQQLLKTLL